ncbi:MAG: type II toxin-antitoxin system RelE/ParE family toxin, partial [Verrucomicrobiota bacterium]
SQAIARIIQAIDRLEDEPRPQGCRKLVGSERTYRIRVGSYRVVYEIEDECLKILVVRVRHRQSAYD